MEEQDFIYERRKLEDGIKLEIISGGNRYKGKVWMELARQIYCENGKDGFREIGHFPSGAPFLYDEDERISISHTDGCMVVATKKVAADANLGEFTPATALGVDVEKADREKVMNLRERFLTKEEQELVAADNLEANVLAWTCKEAMLKAGMNPSIDWHHDIIIDTLPSSGKQGKGHITLEGVRHDFKLVTLKEEGYIITLAVS